MRRTATAVLLALAVTLLSAHGAMGNTVVWTPAHELAPVGPTGSIAAGDLDGDGDDDVADFGYRNEYWSTGCPGLPTWQLEAGVFPDVIGCTENGGTLGDCDADGDLDLIYPCIACCSLRMVWNVGTPHAPVWQHSGAVAGDPYAGYRAKVCLADIDADGDLDLIRAGSDGALWVIVNTGTAQQPYWVQVGYLPGIGFDDSDGSISIGDLDGDGDLDIAGLTSTGPLRCWENTGTPQAWNYVLNAAMLTGVTEPTNGGWGLALPDVDCDGDLDLLVVGHNWTEFLYLNERITMTCPGSWGTIKALYR